MDRTRVLEIALTGQLGYVNSIFAQVLVDGRRVPVSVEAIREYALFRDVPSPV